MQRRKNLDWSGNSSTGSPTTKGLETGSAPKSIHGFSNQSGLSGRFQAMKETKETTDQKRRFVRVRPAASAAKIIVGPRDPAIDCRIVDYSAGGACLEVDVQAKLPNRFVLLYSGTKKSCRVVWSAGRRSGVVF